jgi:ATP-dependent helicase HrpB
MADRPPSPTSAADPASLPVLEALPALKQALREAGAAVLVAPPGAGKTTMVAPALLDEPWVQGGRILVLAPRRLAARAAAARMAALSGEPLGGLVGYTVRLDAKVSARTRIEVVTEGVFVRRILADPELTGVTAVLLDEVHERSLDCDTALALALDVRGALRPDLRLVAMSATVDGARFAALMEGCPVVESQGRMFPVTTVHLPRDPLVPLEQQVRSAVRQALAETDGDVLVFLPGVAEIGRVRRLLDERGLPASVVLRDLHGSLEPGDQDAAIAPCPPGVRKVVLSTAIAETSLTIAGVQAVVDAGLARRPQYEPDTGLTRLVTVRASRASADQRRGRAGRTAPGTCYRLWSEAETGALPAFEAPEILAADLAPLALTLAGWGVADPGQLAFLDPPPAVAWREARALLRGLGALDGDGRATAHGHRLSALPLAPRLAHMVIEAEERFGLGRTAALVAAVLSERGLGGTKVDVAARVEGLMRDGSSRAKAALAQAQGWWRLVRDGTEGSSAARPGTGRQEVEPDKAGLCLALAWPERIARARDRTGGFILAAGRAGELDPAEPLAAAPFLAVAELQGTAAAARILAAARLSPDELEEVAAGRISGRDELVFEPGAGLRGRRVRRLGAITLASAPAPVRPGAEAEAALLEAVRRHGPGILPWSEAAVALRARLAFLASALGQGAGGDWPTVDDAALVADLDSWLAPFVSGLVDLARVDLVAALLARAGRGEAREIDRLAPASFTTPLGITRPIRYDPDTGPVLEVRVQELYGLDRHPVAGSGAGVPLTLELLSPAHRPIARTRDLPAFWRAGWADVRKDMKADYPKHPWPERPWEAQATLRAKPRGT